MIKRRNTFFLGIFIFVIPFLGLPTFWKTIFITFSGLLLVILSINIILPRKSIRTKGKKEKSTPVFVQNSPIYPTEKSSKKLEIRDNPVNKTDTDEISF